MIGGFNKNIDEQVCCLEKIINGNKTLVSILKILDEYSKVNKSFSNYYVGAGGVNQTVFNYYHRFDLENGIKDYDIVYFDEDVSYEAEDVIIKDLEKLLKDVDCVVDIKNQARVHLWYEKKFGLFMKQSFSVEESISRWGTTITCIGIRYSNNKFIVYCPYGLNDLFSMTIRPVKLQFTEIQYLDKCARWKEKWPKLNILDWNE